MRHQLPLRQVLAHHAAAGLDDHTTSSGRAHRELVCALLQALQFGLRAGQRVVGHTGTHRINFEGRSALNLQAFQCGHGTLHVGLQHLVGQAHQRLPGHHLLAVDRQVFLYKTVSAQTNHGFIAEPHDARCQRSVGQGHGKHRQHQGAAAQQADAPSFGALAVQFRGAVNEAQRLENGLRQQGPQGQAHGGQTQHRMHAGQPQR